MAPGDPIAPEIALAQARALEAANQTGDALAAYERVAERFSTTDEGLRSVLARARLIARLGRNADAASVFERLVSDPHLRESLAKAGTTVDAVLAEWGWSLVDAAKPAEADRVFKRLLAEYPQSPYSADARFNLAESAYQDHQYQDVIRLLLPLVVKEPADAPKAGGYSRRRACSPRSCIGWGAPRWTSGTGPAPRPRSIGCWPSFLTHRTVANPDSCAPSPP